jgi:hypothetical protein
MDAVVERLVDTVHEINPEALVFVSGVDWGYDLSGAIKDPVRRDNIIYETHPYSGKGEGWKAVLDELRKTTAVFLAEWGFEPGAEDRNLRGTAERYGNALLRYAKERNIGGTAWQWRLPYSELGMLESWEGYKNRTTGASLSKKPYLSYRLPNDMMPLSTVRNESMRFR